MLLRVDAPRWFYSVYALVERFIDPVTRARVQMCADAAALQRRVPPQALPSCLEPESRETYSARGTQTLPNVAREPGGPQPGALQPYRPRGLESRAQAV